MIYLVNPLNLEWKIYIMERRKFTRFRTRNDAFAAPRGDFSKVGKIKDISLNGLAFRYLAENVCNEKFSRVDIFLSENGFHLSGVPCTVIYDEKTSTPDSQAVSAYRCGLNFETLKREQQVKLEFFLNTHTIGRV